MTFSPLVATCMYNRPKVSELFLRNMKRLGLPVLAAVSDEESHRVCNEENQAMCITVENEPLGNKWNELIKYALMFPRWSHLIITGDDDLFSHDFITRLEQDQEHPFLGIQSTYMVSPKDKKALHFKYDTGVALGGGRMLKREVVESLGGVLYDSTQNKSIDHAGDMMLFEKGYRPFLIDMDKTLCVSVKTSQNIWAIDTFEPIAPRIDYDLALSILSDDERRGIDEL